MKGVQPHLDAIDRLESEGDAVYRRTLARLFSGEFEALEVLRVEGHRRGDGGRPQHARGHLRRRRVDRPQARLTPTRVDPHARTVVTRHRGRVALGVRLRQRLPRRGQLDRHRGLDPGADAADGRGVGRVLQLRRVPGLRRRTSPTPSPRTSSSRTCSRSASIFAGLIGAIGLEPAHVLPRAADAARRTRWSAAWPAPRSPGRASTCWSPRACARSASSSSCRR